MLGYIIIYLVAMFSVLNTFKYEKRLGTATSLNIGKETTCLFVSNVMAVALFTGFRDMIGGYDVYNYASYFYDCPFLLDLFNGNYSLINASRFEPGYWFFNILIKSIYNNHYFLFLSSAFLSYLLIGLCIKRYNNPIFIFFIFISKFLIVGFAYNRQFISIAIVWWALKFLEKEKLKKFILCVFIASTFHFGALIVLPLVLIYKTKFKEYIIFFMLAICLFLGLSPALPVLQEIASGVLGIEKLMTYAEQGTSEIHIFYLLESLFLIICVIVYRKKLYSTNKNTEILIFNILIIYLCCCLLTLRTPGVIRYSWFFSIGYIVYFPRFVYYLVKDKAAFFFIVLLYFSGVYYRNYSLRDGGNYIPYKFFFLDYPERKDIHNIYFLN